MDLVALAEAREDDLKTLFKRCDVNNDGALQPDELAALLLELGLPHGKDAVKECFSRFDDDADGNIQFSEFVKHWNELSSDVTKAARAREWTCKKHAINAHSIFLSYRVASEKAFVKLLALSLEAHKRKAALHPTTVFLDQVCLRDGEDWQVGFLSGLGSSRLFVAVISEKSLQGIIDNAAKRKDNVLLEIEMALDRFKDGTMAILPLLLGEHQRGAVPGGGEERDMFLPFKTPRMDKFPDAPHATGGSRPRNIRATMAELFQLQGVKIDPEDGEAGISNIISMLDDFEEKLAKADAARAARAAAPTHAPSFAAASSAPAPSASERGAVTATPASYDATVEPGASVQTAVNKVKTGGNVLLAPGVHTGPLMINREVHIWGGGAATLVAGGSDEVIVSKAAKATVNSLTVKKLHKGEGADGYTVWVKGGGVIFTDCDLLTESEAAIVAVSGGAASGPTFRRCRVHDSTKAAFYCYDGSRAKVEGCEVWGCAGPAVSFIGVGTEGDVSDTIVRDTASAAVFVSEKATGRFRGCDLSATGDIATALVNEESKADFTGCNVHDGALQGVYVGDKAAVAVTDCQFSCNGAPGIVAESDGVVVATGCEVRDHTETVGVLADGGTVKLVRCELYSNAVANAGCQNGATLEATDCIVRDGLAHGLLLLKESKMRLDKCVMSGNEGIGVFVQEDADFVGVDCKITAGSGFGVCFAGAGGRGVFERCDISGHAKANVHLHTGGHGTMRGCRITGGRQDGIYITAGSTGLFESCVIEGNGDAGVCIATESNPTVTGCTIRGNTNYAIKVEGTAVGGGVFAANNTIEGQVLREPAAPPE